MAEITKQSAISERVQSSRSPTEQRILQLLGQGIPQNVVASTVGVAPGYISQLISDDEFKNELQSLKFDSLQKHNKRDDRYDELEDKLTTTLESNLCLIQKPGELLRAIQIVNSLKRRGSGTPEAIHQQQNVVNLTIPQTIVQKFTTNINNQVINVGSQTLETMQSSTLLNSTREKRAAQNAEFLEHHTDTETSQLFHTIESNPNEILEVTSRSGATAREESTEDK